MANISYMDPYEEWERCAIIIHDHYSLGHYSATALVEFIRRLLMWFSNEIQDKKPYERDVHWKSDLRAIRFIVAVIHDSRGIAWGIV